MIFLRGFSHPTPYLAFFIFSVESRVLAVCKYTFAESPPHFFISSFSSFPRCILRRCGNAQRGRSSCSRTRGEKNSKYKKHEIALKRTRNFKVEPAFFLFFSHQLRHTFPRRTRPCESLRLHQIPRTIHNFALSLSRSLSKLGVSHLPRTLEKNNKKTKGTSRESVSSKQ